MGKIKQLATESFKWEEVAIKREKATGYKKKGLQAQLLAANIQVEDLKSEKEDVEAAKDELSDRLRRTQDHLASRDKELEELKKREDAFNVEVAALKEEVAFDQALTRLTARAALMWQHTRGLNPMARAQEELHIFLSFGSHDDLDRDDEKDEGEVEEEEEVVAGDVAGDDIARDDFVREEVVREDVSPSGGAGDEEEAAKDGTSGSAQPEDPPVV